MFASVMKKNAKGQSPSPVKAKNSKPVAGRERLHHFNAELAKANEAVTDLERRVATLENIGIDAAAADRALQLFIAQDGGTDALLSHSAGKTKPDDQISKLISAAKATAEAAAPAKAALPLAVDALERARSEVFRLGEEKSAEIGRFLTLLGDETARRYKRAFEECAKYHDELMGFANGTSNLGEVAMVAAELTVPRFNLPSLACLNEYDPFMRHRANDYAVGSSARTWLEVRSRLESDVDADIGDLVA